MIHQALCRVQEPTYPQGLLAEHADSAKLTAGMKPLIQLVSPRRATVDGGSLTGGLRYALQTECENLG